MKKSDLNVYSVNIGQYLPGLILFIGNFTYNDCANDGTINRIITVSQRKA